MQAERDARDVLPDGDETYDISANAGRGRTLAAKHDDSSKRKINVDSRNGPVTVRDVSATAEEEESTTPRP